MRDFITIVFELCARFHARHSRRNRVRGKLREKKRGEKKRLLYDDNEVFAHAPKPVGIGDAQGVLSLGIAIERVGPRDALS